MASKENLYYNSEGYADPTAYAVVKKELDEEKRLGMLITALKNTITLSGFELLNRIELKDSKTGKVFR